MGSQAMSAGKIIRPAPQSAVLITGVAGFVGFHLARHYLRAGFAVIGADNPADFHKTDIRRQRMAILRREMPEIKEGDLSIRQFAEDAFAPRPDIVFHLAASAGARCRNTGQFWKNNLETLVNMLAVARSNPPAHFLFASSSAVYGENAPRPFCETYAVSQTGRPYADSKIACEKIARFCSEERAFPVTCARFFNIYGPWGREEMALFRFADCLARGLDAPIITGGAMRSWLYIDDAISTCAALAQLPPENYYRVVNIAGPRLVRTIDALNIIARKMNITPRTVSKPPPFPELTSNPADLSLLKHVTGKIPETEFEDGVDKFLAWHKQYRRKQL